MYSSIVLAANEDHPRLPYYFISGAQPYTALWNAARAAGIDWGKLCELVVLPDNDDPAFYAWLLDYLKELHP